MAAVIFLGLQAPDASAGEVGIFFYECDANGEPSKRVKIGEIIPKQYRCPPRDPPKPFQYNADRGVCLSANGVPGNNALPELPELVTLKDWECYDFSNRDFAVPELDTAFEVSSRAFTKSIRGSNFSGAKLAGRTIAVPFSGARFQNADLAGATIRAKAGGGDHVDFSGADLSQSTVASEPGLCARDWDLRGAKLGGVHFAGLHVCEIQLSGTIAYPTIHDVDLRDVRIPAGLTIEGARGSGLGLAGVSGTTLVLSHGDLEAITMAGLRLESFVARGIGADDDGSTLEVRDARTTVEFVAEDSHFSRLSIGALTTARLVLEAVKGPVTISQSALAFATVRAGQDLTFSGTTLNKADIQNFGELAFTSSSRCDACALLPGDRATLTVDNSTLAGLTVKGDLGIKARAAILAGSRWTSVAWAPGSSLVDVELTNSTFDGSELDLVMAGVRLSDSIFTRSPIRLVEGSKEVDCERCGDILVLFQADRVQGLRFAGTRVDFSNQRTSDEWELVGLAVSHGSLRGQLNGGICRDCDFENADVKATFDRSTLINPGADRARFSGFSSSQDEGVTVRGGRFTQAVFSGNLIKANFNEVDLSDAVFEGPLSAGVSSSNFARVTLKGGMIDAEVLDSDFSEASFPSMSHALHQTTFVRTRFSGATFPGGGDHSVRPVFENCSFDGPHGPAAVKNLLQGARGLRVIGADWAGVDLSGVLQQDVELVSVNLRGASLRGLALGGVTMEDVTLDQADLSHAVLQGKIANSSLHQATVGGARIEGALSGVALSHLVRSEDLISLTADLEDVDLSGSDLHNVHPGGATYRRLTLTDTVLSCEMRDVIRKQGTITYGSYRAQQWDGLSSSSCSEAEP